MRRILITLGDPAGIGPEVIDAALASDQLPTDFVFEVLGDRTLGTLGKPDKQSAAESHRALREAAWKLRDDDNVAAVVTGPASKDQLQSDGFSLPGQTEFFAQAAGVKHFGMCLTGNSLTVALATIHIPLAKVPELLKQAEIVTTGTLLAQFVAQRKGSEDIQIAVAGLNPHAGEGGRFGDEEESVITPAIQELNEKFPGVFSGPHVPDAVFRDASMGHYDAVLAMYHDQGLIPLKLLDFDSAVNVTLGLPKPRTSPDHGTAFAIAGKGIANPNSMIRAIQVAAELARDS